MHDTTATTTSIYGHIQYNMAINKNVGGKGFILDLQFCKIQKFNGPIFRKGMIILLHILIKCLI